jgi:hypothetical protein
VREALRQNCGRIRAFIPKSLLKREWQWSDFEFKLKYKTDQVGIRLEVIREADEDEEKKGHPQA